ncbi:general transcription factor 3C polypeptide 6 isoform X1 [Takifugu flavidus]|uniref:general transcription factor 3C polypeptide 6 isoform X1 n=2 Tax=Takifugu flavidus TaxID=433684 RepID=UPI00254451F8|nr:general transcription factor 3C polypeptide 6 isoform X1 [Takifugu flavidus]
MEDEWEEEEQLVVVELAGIINSDFMSKCGGSCKILDIASEKPMMQVGQYVFAGEYEDALGTCVLFEEGQKKDHVPELKYTCHTVKKLMMQRIFLTEKKECETSEGSGDCDDLNCASCPSQEERDKQGESEDHTSVTDFQDLAKS